MARDTLFDGSSSLSLAQRLADGSSAAWVDLVELYGPLLDRWCRVAGVPRESIPDVAQEVFLAVFRGMEGFDAQQRGATFRGWLWTVTRNRIRDFYRRQQRLNGAAMSDVEVERIPDPVPCEEPSDSADIIGLTRRAMRRVEAEFEARTWQMFLDAVVMGHPTAVIAERHGVTTATIRQAKSRVLRRLRQELGES